MAARRRVFISFDYDHDEGVKIMLAGQAKLADSPFEFTDASVKEPLSGDWKEKVRRRLRNVDVVIGLCGEHTHKAAGVAAEIAIPPVPIIGETATLSSLMWGRGGKDGCPRAATRARVM